MTAAFSPTREGERIITLDVLRGFALIGIMLANIRLFAVPWSDLGTPATGAGAIEHATFWFVRLAIEYKFYSLFALLFGAGFILQFDRARHAQRSFSGMYLRRLIVLAIIGVLHGLLLWYGDILLLYAICGALMLPVRRCSACQFIVIGCMLMLAGTMLGLWRQWPTSTTNTTAGTIMTAPAAAAAPVAETPSGRLGRLLEAAGGNAHSDAWRAAEHLAYRDGPMSVTVRMRAAQFRAMFKHSYAAGGTGLHALGMFCLGAAMMRAGWLFRISRRAAVRLISAGLIVGAALEGVATILLLEVTTSGWRLAVSESLHRLAAPLIALAVVGMFLYLAGSTPRWWQRALAAAGRLALTNYLAQSIVAGIIMSWWGLALFDQLTGAAQLGIGLAIALAQIPISLLWLHWFNMGPVEWAWRAATYRQLPSLWREPDRSI